MRYAYEKRVGALCERFEAPTVSELVRLVNWMEWRDETPTLREIEASWAIPGNRTHA